MCKPRLWVFSFAVISISGEISKASTFKPDCASKIEISPVPQAQSKAKLPGVIDILFNIILINSDHSFIFSFSLDISYIADKVEYGLIEHTSPV